MKFFIGVFTLTILFTISASAQQTSKVEGLGIFKIGKTTSEIVRSFAQEWDEDIETADDLMKFVPYWDRGGKVIFKLVRNKQNPEASPMFTFTCPGVETFFLGEYEVAGMVINQVFLIFYNDTLLAVRTTKHSKELDEALEIKFGQPSIRSEKKTYPCFLSSIGETIEREFEWFYSTYGSGSIVAESLIGGILDANCEKQTIYWLTVKNTVLADRVLTCEGETQQVIKKHEEEKTREKVKDL